MSDKTSTLSAKTLAILAACGLSPRSARVGRYFIGDMLGMGSSAMVHHGLDGKLLHEVALKRLRPELVRDPVLRERLRREAIALGWMRSQGVVQLHDVELDGPEPYIAMELVQGPTLREFASAFRPLSPHAVMVLICDLARTLVTVHQADVIHRDLKPSHVIIDSESVGRLVLFDFGLASLPEIPGIEPLTQQGLFIGTFGYAPPEQMQGETVGAEVDQFALAVMAYELLFGRRPFAGGTVWEQVELIKKQRYVRPQEGNPRVPDALAEVIERGLRYAPQERWPSMAALARELERGLRHDLFEDPTVELRSLLAGPAPYLSQLEDRVMSMLRQKMFVLIRQGQIDAAARECRRALAWRPGDAEYTQLLADLTRRIEEGGTARTDFVPTSLGPGEVPWPGALGGVVVYDAALAKAAVPSEPNRLPELDLLPESSLLPEPRPESPPKEPAPEAQAMEVVSETPAGAGKTEPPPAFLKPRGRRRRVMGGVAAGALLAGGMFLAPRLHVAHAPHEGGASSGLAEVWDTPPTVRPFPQRFQASVLAEYLPPPPESVPGTPGIGQAAGMAGQAKIRLATLGRLAEKGDRHGLAITSLLQGGPGRLEQALTILDEIAPPPPEDSPQSARVPSLSPDIDSDRAAILLLQGRPIDAYLVAERVLVAQPEHRAAQWSQALALQDLGALQGAAATFGRIEAAGERGWSTEAGMRKAALLADFDEERRAFAEMQAQGKAMVAGGPVPVELGKRWPGFLRLYFYDAVRTATSPARVRELLPLAEVIDQHDRGEVLARYARRIAGRPFGRRAQLAGVYAQLVANSKSLGKEAQEDYFAALRAAGESDLLLGALLHTHRVGDHLAEYEALARATEDPWFVFLAETEHANVEVARGETRQAEQRLLAVLKTCQEEGLEFRCIRLEYWLARLYLSLYSLPEAEAHVRAGMQMARKTGDWEYETVFLSQFGVIAYHQNDAPLGMALIDEMGLREPENCVRQRYTHEYRAYQYVGQFRFEEAGRELQAAPSCDEPRSIQYLFLWATLERVGVIVGSPTRMREELAAVRRRRGLSPAELALAIHIEGLHLIRRDRDQGRTLLGRAAFTASHLPIQDLGAQRVTFHSYEELALDAGRTGHPEDALAALAAQRGVSPPYQCVFGALVGDERTLVVWRGLDGVAQQWYQARRSSLGVEVASLLSPDLKVALQGCPKVSVFAHPLLHTQTELLPPEWVWSFREGPPMPTQGEAGQGSQLIVQRIEPPPGFQVQPLPVWSVGIGSIFKRTVLEGPVATPSNVLTEIRSASVVVLQAHAVTIGDHAYVLLSPGADGRYALTADMVLERPFENAPIIILNHMHRTEISSYLQDTWSMPMILRQARSGPVFSVVGATPQDEVESFFGMVIERIQGRQDPAVALHDVRMIWLQEKHREWVRNVGLFD